MKNALASLVLLTSCVLPLTAAAQPKPPGSTESVVVRCNLAEMSDEAAARYGDEGRIAGDFPATGGGVRLIQTTELMVRVGCPAVFHVGRKYPIVYYDPKASQFQIQYVDVGLKLDVLPRREGDNEFTLDANPEVSVLDKIRMVGTPPVTGYPQTTVLRSQAISAHVHFGDRFIVGSFHGPSAQHYLEALEGPSGTGHRGNNLSLVITLLKP